MKFTCMHFAAVMILIDLRLHCSYIYSHFYFPLRHSLRRLGYSVTILHALRTLPKYLYGTVPYLWRWLHILCRRCAGWGATCATVQRGFILEPVFCLSSFLVKVGSDLLSWCWLSFGDVHWIRHRAWPTNGHFFICRGTSWIWCDLDCFAYQYNNHIYW